MGLPGARDVADTPRLRDAMKAMTDVTAKNAKPSGKPYKIRAGKGLFLLIHPNSGKYWRFKYRFAGKEKLLALGVYPDVSVLEAGKRLNDARDLLTDGKDPAQAKREDKRQQRTSADNCFESIAREWIAKESLRWTADHAAATLYSLQSNIFPGLGARPITEIKATDILDALRKIEKRGALDIAGRVRQRCGAIFRYAIQTGRATANPVGDLAGAIATRPVTHRTALKRADMPEFLRKLEAYDGHRLTKCALKLLVLTFVRTGELRGARWDEFDVDQAVWRIPAERMKMKRDHIVPLSKQALAVLEEVRPISGKGDFVFPVQSGTPRPMSENTMLFALYRMGYHSKATGHGFRSTASTILHEIGWKSDAIERQLAHVEANKVKGSYNDAEHLPYRKKMMKAWANLLDSLRTEPEKVVPIGRAKAA